LIGYIYRITICKNGSSLDKHYYIGLHKSNKFDDRYYGSGRIIRDFRKKYGCSFFHKEILDTANDIDELMQLEIYYIKGELNNPFNINIQRGGRLGNRGVASNRRGMKLSEETKDKIRATIKKHPREFSLERREKISKRVSGKGNPMYAVNVKDRMSEDAYQKMLQKRKVSMTGQMKGEDNPMFNREISTTEIIHLYEKGDKLSLIAKKLGCTYHLVWSRLNSSNKLKMKKVIDINKILSLKCQGLNHKQIADILGCTPQNIKYRLKTQLKR